MSDNQPSMHYRSPRPSLFWPIILIGAGVIFLLYNLGILTNDPWPLLGKLWPIILIVIGLDILLGRRSILGGILSAMFALLVIAGIVALLFAAQNYPVLLDLGTAELQTEHISYPIGEARQAQVEIDFSGGEGYILGLDDSSNLIEGEIRYYGNLSKSFATNDNTAQIRLDSQHGAFKWWSSAQEKWTIGLNPRVEYDLKLGTGSGDYEFDLRQFTLRSFRLDGGSGQIRLMLPEVGQYRFRLRGGSGDIDVHVPEGVAVRLEHEAGSGELDAPGLTRVSGDWLKGIYESSGFTQTGYYVIIELDGGSGDVTIR